MKPTREKQTVLKAVLFFVTAAFLLSGCTTPLTQEEKAAGKAFYLKTALSPQLQYRKVGTTIFQNSDDYMSAAEINGILVSGTRKALEARGHFVVERLADADYIIRISTVDEDVYEHMGARVETTAGFYARSLLGMSPQIAAQAFVGYDLIDPVTYKRRDYATIVRTSVVPIRKAPPAWEDFSAEERDIMMGELKKHAEAIPGEALGELGL